MKLYEIGFVDWKSHMSKDDVVAHLSNLRRKKHLGWSQVTVMYCHTDDRRGLSWRIISFSGSVRGIPRSKILTT